MRKIEPEKMTRTVRFLYEFSVIKNLSPEKLAPFLGVSKIQIYRWYYGAEPKRIMERKILEGIEKIKKEIPGDTPDGLVSWGRRWNVPEDKALKKKEEKFHCEMDRFFSELEQKAGPNELTWYFPDYENDCLVFQSFCDLAQRYKVKLPRSMLCKGYDGRSIR
jgi:hypothetical protein